MTWKRGAPLLPVSLYVRAIHAGNDEHIRSIRLKGSLTFPGHPLFMNPVSMDVFTAAERRLAWTSERQAVLARNIANVDTPGFQAMDARDFRQALAGSTGVQPARTMVNHLAGTIDPGLANRPSRQIAARTADKNEVRMEDQLMKVADTETIHSTVTAIYKKYMTMFGIALGKSA